MNKASKGRSSDHRASIRIRAAKVRDSARIAFLSGELGYPVTTRKMERCIRTVLRRKDQRIFVAEVNGTVNGWLEVFLPRSVLNWGKAEVGALIVDHGNRGSGLGGRLLEAARRWSEEHKSKFIYLRSNIKRKEAHRFYENAGYRVRKTQFVFQFLLDKKRKGQRT